MSNARGEKRFITSLVHLFRDRELAVNITPYYTVRLRIFYSCVAVLWGRFNVIAFQISDHSVYALLYIIRKTCTRMYRETLMLSAYSQADKIAMSYSSCCYARRFTENAIANHNNNIKLWMIKYNIKNEKTRTEKKGIFPNGISGVLVSPKI